LVRLERPEFANRPRGAKNLEASRFDLDPLDTVADLDVQRAADVKRRGDLAP
jgi:hypothetical protein